MSTPSRPFSPLPPGSHARARARAWLPPLVLSLLLSSPWTLSPAQQKVYKSVGPDGVVTYSERPPEGDAPVDTLSVESAPSTGASAPTPSPTRRPPPPDSREREAAAAGEGRADTGASSWDSGDLSTRPKPSSISRDRRAAGAAAKDGSAGRASGETGRGRERR